VLDDRDDALRRESSAESWRTWLHLANLAQGDPFGDSLRMTTKSLVEAGTDVGSDEARAPRVPSAAPPHTAPTTPEPATPEPAALAADYALRPEDGAEEPLSPAWQGALADADGETEKQLIGVLARYDLEP